MGFFNNTIVFEKTESCCLSVDWVCFCKHYFARQSNESEYDGFKFLSNFENN